jgi:AAA domain/RepB DNA-primase from phage plasmid
MHSPYTTRQNGCQLALVRRLWDYQSQGKWRFICTRDPNLPKGHKDRWREHAFEDWSMQVLEHFVRRHSHLDLYFCPHGFTKAIRKKEYAVIPLMLYADLDKVHPSTCVPAPNIWVESSKGRYQAYWMLTKQLDRDVWEKLNQRLTYAIGADKGGWDLTQVLRIPSTVNHKYEDEPTVRTLLSGYGETYDPADIDRTIPDRRSKHDNGGDAAARAWRRLRGRISPELRHALRTTTTPKERSDKQFGLECQLAEIGATVGEIHAIMADCGWQKFDGDRLDEEMERLGRKKELDEPLIVAQPFVSKDPSEYSPIDFIYGKQYIRGVLSLTAANGGVGKTRLGVTEMLAMITGRPLLGVTPRRKVRGWYISEESMEQVAKYFDAAMIYYNIPRSEVDGNLFITSMKEYSPLMVQYKKDGLELCMPMHDAVCNEMTSKEIDVAIVDPLVKTHAVGENDNMAMAKVAAAWSRVAHDTNSSVHAMHHTRKTNGRELTQDDARGGSATMDEVDAGRMAQKHDKDPFYFRTDDPKLRHSEPTRESVWYHLVKVDFGREVHGIGVIEQKDPPSFEAAKTIQRKVIGRMHDREQTAINALVALGRANMTEWEQEAGLPHASMYRLSTKFIKSGRIAKDGDTYTILH